MASEWEYLGHAVTSGLPAVTLVSAVSAVPGLSLLTDNRPLVLIHLGNMLLRLLVMKVVVMLLLLEAVPLQGRGFVVVVSRGVVARRSSEER